MVIDKHISWLELHYKLYLNSIGNDALEKVFIFKIGNYINKHPEIIQEAKNIIGKEHPYSDSFFSSFYAIEFFEDSLYELISILKSTKEHI